MGGHYQISRGKARTYRDLIKHPSFTLPPLPDFLTTRPEDKPMALVDYVSEVIARFLSPSPKVADEDEDFSCNDLARAIREHLRPLIKQEIHRRARATKE